MASGNYRADHIGGVLPVPGSAGEFADDPVAGAVDAQLKAVMDVFTDGAASHTPADAVASAAALRERAPSWARLKVVLPAPVESDQPIIDCANELFARGVAYVQFNADDPRAIDGDLLGGLEVPEGSTTGLYLDSAAGLLKNPELAATVFALPIARFLIAFSAADEIELVRSIPKDRFAVLGIVDATTKELEDPEPLLEMIDTAAAIHGDLLAVSPTQGFVGTGLTALDQQRKLALVSDVARMFWGTEL